MIATILTAIGVVVTGLGSWLVAKTQTNFTRQKYYEDKISEIMLAQSNEIKGLKEEIEKLVQENRWLRLELERSNRCHEKEIAEVSN